MLAYQVCEWTRSTPAAAAAISRSTPSVASEKFASASSAGGVKARASGLGSPKHSTSTSTSRRSSRTRKSTCTPAPPYTSGGNSRVRIAARMPRIYPGSAGNQVRRVSARRCGAMVLGMAKVLAIVLAGGEGKRLMPLTVDRAKPAVPFGGSYRLIDFALSNLVNAGYRRCAVLTQYKSHSLDRHISVSWRLSPMLGDYVTPVPAQQRRGPQWYLGSADAIYQSMNLINDERLEIVVVFGADHVYRRDAAQMVQAHRESGADVTVAGIRVPRKEAWQFGVIKAAADGVTIEDFLEKPA